MPDDLPARERILAAAERLFAERGFDHTSTALVAAEARVPQGLIFYHFKTKMELLLAVIREDQDSLLDVLPPAQAPAADPDDGLRQAVAVLWRHLSAVLGDPSPVRKIMIQELAAHPEIRQRALELHEQMAASVACYLAQAGPHPRKPGPEHQAAARLLTIAAGMAPLLGEPSLTLIPPDTLGTLISDGLRAGPAGPPEGIAPVRPEQSREDTDAEWGEPAEPDDDERLYRDRPPHWDSV
jgi:AcrR family transcriptional regulator